MKIKEIHRDRDNNPLISYCVYLDDGSKFQVHGYCEIDAIEQARKLDGFRKYLEDTRPRSLAELEAGIAPFFCTGEDA